LACVSQRRRHVVRTSPVLPGGTAAPAGPTIVCTRAEDGDLHRILDPLAEAGFHYHSPGGTLCWPPWAVSDTSQPIRIDLRNRTWHWAPFGTPCVPSDRVLRELREPVHILDP